MKTGITRTVVLSAALLLRLASAQADPEDNGPE